jgi:circadian clock protein KaiC
MLGPNMTSTANVSYLADNVIMLRYFEARGEVQQAISVFKKRGGRHERTIRHFSMSAKGIEVGPVLREFHGILSGIPNLLDNAIKQIDDVNTF